MEMAGANQFLDFVLERFTFVYSVTIILMVSIVLGHVDIRGLGCFVRWWDEIGMEGFVEKLGSGDA